MVYGANFTQCVCTGYCETLILSSLLLLWTLGPMYLPSQNVKKLPCCTRSTWYVPHAYHALLIVPWKLIHLVICNIEKTTGVDWTTGIMDWRDLVLVCIICHVVSTITLQCLHNYTYWLFSWIMPSFRLHCTTYRDPRWKKSGTFSFYVYFYVLRCPNLGLNILYKQHYILTKESTFSTTGITYTLTSFISLSTVWYI